MNSIIERDLIPENFLERLDELQRQVTDLARLVISTSAADARYLQRAVSSADTTTPPTLAELEKAFGAAATLPNPFFGILDDGGAGTDFYLCIAANGKWMIEILTVVS